MKLFVSCLLNVETTVAVRGFPISYYPIDYPFFGIQSHVSGVGYNIAKAAPRVFAARAGLRLYLYGKKYKIFLKQY